MQLNNKFWAKYLAIVFAFLVSFFALTGCSAASGTTIGDSFNKILETGSNIIGNSSSNSGGSSSAVSGTLDVYTLDIGQGDAHLIKVGDEYTLIDTGDVDHRDSLVAQLKKYNVKSLKNVIITHPHSDHLGGFHALIDAGIPIEHVYDNGMKYKTSVYNTYAKDTDKKNLKRIGLYKGMTVDLGKDAQFVVYAPEEGQYIMDKKGQPDPNDNSIVGKLVFGKFSMLFTGDASRAEENKLIKEENTKLFSRILKVGHHGSASSSQKDFIRSVRPEKAVISVGLHNDYGHPTSQALQRLAAENVMVYRTDTQGTIRIHTDGNTWQVTTER
ncbi:ComEC/Rec2 family competence protein [Veillonella sp. CAG:933]|uniref:ComEC/Rec2 family competence protein n=1 Tax=Veillonella sp. CAG:933 TaxID=1262980 RepID=UPI00033B2D7E|nr:ComEC/Rec2 family competence protein [Veillonella sp. CAG:933]CCX54530.1 metallo-beta-lactamase domain protein [Veillonella sp. CAG:933]